MTLERRDALSVYPRIFQLDVVFSDAGPLAATRAAPALRSAGYDLHSSATSCVASGCGASTGARPPSAES